ncbi:hypothetical protein HK101_006646, partial [Irineochytrium annulatum]
MSTHTSTPLDEHLLDFDSPFEELFDAFSPDAFGLNGESPLIASGTSSSAFFAGPLDASLNLPLFDTTDASSSAFDNFFPELNASLSPAASATLATPLLTPDLAFPSFAAPAAPAPTASLPAALASLASGNRLNLTPAQAAQLLANTERSIS